MDFIYDELMGEYGAVTFEAFINLLVSLTRDRASRLADAFPQVDITEDQTTAEQLREAFQGIAADKVRWIAVLLSCHQSHVILPAIRNRARPASRPPPDQRYRLFT